VRTPLASLSASFVGGYRYSQRLRGKLFSLAVAQAFAEFGPNSTLQPPVRVLGERRIAIGARVFVGPGSWLQALDGEDRDGIAIEIGNGTSIAGGCTISAVVSVRLGENVLVARNVYIADHRHAYEDPDRPVIAQGIANVAPIEVGDGAWLGQNVVVGPGVRIGPGAVVGANAVVLADVPDHSVAVGAPARVVRMFGGALEYVG
jgi:acetyltransferase-like isoleucine patch superfamily enzyme